MTDTFDRWFASYLHHDELQVARLLKDKTATRFLITWSIFESDCFSGFVQFKEINDYSNKIIVNSKFKREKFVEFLRYFHNRYQDPQLYENLMHTQKSAEVKQILKKDMSVLTHSEEIFFLVTVVYRYRNNIFHGNKGVSSWLKFREQIDLCRNIMQELINIADTAHDKALSYARE